MNSKFDYNKFLKKKSCAIYLFHGVVDKKNLGVINIFTLINLKKS